jgi:hypothetical protein
MHGSPAFFLWLLVCVMIAASVAWSLKILHRSDITQPLSLTLFGCALLAIEFSIGTYNFGQREHLLFILLVPYLLAVATGAVVRLSVAERCALGIAAGTAIWFKPQDTIILVALELFLAIRFRSLRRLITPEFLALLITAAVILASVLLFTPLYFRQTLPLLFDTYWAMGTTDTVTLAMSLQFYSLLVLAVLIACVAYRRTLQNSIASLALLVCSVAAAVAFVLQHTNWPYHRFVPVALLQLTIAYLAIDLLSPQIAKVAFDQSLATQLSLLASICMAIMLGALITHRPLVLRDPNAPQYIELDNFLAQYKPSTSIYVFSTAVPPLASAFNHGLNWGGRFAHLWMLPAIVQNELGPTVPHAPFKRLSPETLSRTATRQRTQSAEDLDYWRPSVVLVQRCNLKSPCQGIAGKNFDMLAWFLQSQDFAKAWSHYQRNPSSLDAYDLYVRTQ